jgi:hypothetical protein
LVATDTASGTYKLQVNGSAQIRVGESLSFQNVAGNGDASINCSGGGTNTDLSFKTASTERMRIDSSGRLLVGTSSAPTQGTFAQDALLIVKGAIGGSAGRGIINLSSGSPATSLSSGFDVGGAVFSDSNGGEFARITCVVDDTPGSNDYPGRLVFSTTSDGASSPTERMRLDANGNLQVSVGQFTVGTTASTGLQFINDGTFGTLHSAPLKFRTASSERMRIDTSGRLLIGTTTDSGSQLLQMIGGSSATADVFIGNSVASTGQTAKITMAPANSIAGAQLICTAEEDFSTGANRTARLSFATRLDGNLDERMRLGKEGRLDVFADTPFRPRSSASAGEVVALIYGFHSATSTTTGTNSFQVWSNGNVKNTNNSYLGISDIKLKENIVDAPSQWDDLKAFQVRNYNFNPETGAETFKQIGLVAQEVELVSPGLVSESPDRDADGNDLGTVTKSVNYSVLYMKAVKALQEAMERIETLEQRLSDAGIA